MNPTISFIIPVYNSAKYLEDCIRSILGQNICKFEIILVDDCSKDSSGKICKQFEKTNEDIFYLKNEKNFGPGYCRNRGMAQARGEYLHFIDSDDFLLGDSFADIMDYINKGEVDIIYLNDIVVTETGGMLVSNPSANSNLEKVMQNEEFLLWLQSKEIGSPSAWRLIIKAELLYKNHISFLEGYMSEEFTLTIRAILNANNILVMKQKSYCYREGTQNSITTTMNNERAKESQLRAIIDMFTILQNFQTNKLALMLVESQFKILVNTFGYLTLVSNKKLSKQTMMLGQRLEEIVCELKECLDFQSTLADMIYLEGFSEGIRQYAELFERVIENAINQGIAIILAPATKRNLKLAHIIKDKYSKVALFDNHYKNLEYGGIRVYGDLNDFICKPVIFIIYHHKNNVKSALENQLFNHEKIVL